ncbi:MAG: DUF3604 domain-containing protein [Planctomycetota bacterium]
MRRLPALVLVLLAACSRQAVDVHDLDWAGPEKGPGIQPTLLVLGDRVVLAWAGPRGTLQRTWNAGELGREKPLQEAFPASLVSGRLNLDELPALDFRGSSPTLRNGLLTREGKRAGWSPSLARTSDGKMHLAYDRATAGDFDVIYRAPDGKETVVAGSPAFEAHASLAADSSDRLWLAWDSGRTDWGRGTGLHQERRLHLAVKVEEAWHDVPLPDAGIVEQADSLTSGSLRPQEFGPAELPRVVADEKGPVWLLYRLMTRWSNSGNRGAARRIAWEIRAVALTEEGWTRPVSLPHSDGPNHDTLAAAPLPGGGLLAAYETDNRVDRFPDVQIWGTPVSSLSKIRVVELHVEGQAPEGGPVREVGRKGSRAPGFPDDPDPALVPEGFVRLWGDLHRHSDLSRCKADLDGSVLDQYRYAAEVAHLDFLAMTDHFQHLTPAHWAFHERMADLLDEPGGFTALFGFERVLPNGHRNLICIDRNAARNGPFLPFDAQDPWKGFDPDQWVVIPHQVADRFALLDWGRHRPDLETEVEIHQGRRGSYESLEGPRRDFGDDPSHPHVVDYLEEGKKFGFVGSSDHISTSRGFAAVLARANTRPSIFEALKARRTYAATALIALDVRLGERLVGEEGPVPGAAPLRIRAAAGGEIARIEVIRNGEVVRSWHGGDSSRKLLTFRCGRAFLSVPWRLTLENASLREIHPLLLEDGDGIRHLSETEAVLEARLDNTDDDGMVIHLDVSPAAALKVDVQDDSRSFSLADLRPGEPLRFRMANAPCELRLDPGPLGGERAELSWAPGDWKGGDWVYVRLVRSDGEVAWSSPIWVR